MLGSRRWHAVSREDADGPRPLVLVGVSKFPQLAAFGLKVKRWFRLLLLCLHLPLLLLLLLLLFPRVDQIDQMDFYDIIAKEMTSGGFDMQAHHIPQLRTCQGAKTTLKFGRLHGEYKTWHPEGHLKEHGHYKLGRRHGKYKKWW